jgi:site-specific DNA-methyltransferase (adenine-specific)
MFQVVHDDCLNAMAKIDNQSIDLILCDLPYGSTACAWDSPIDLAALWLQYKRIIKPHHAIVLTASQPFTTVLAASNLSWLRYEWIWLKNRPTNFAHAKNKPMKTHENILVFSEGTTVHVTQSKTRMPYYPQGLLDLPDNTRLYEKLPSELTEAFFNPRPSHGQFTRQKTGYPRSVLAYATDQLGLHPTAKPLALMKYLIETYTIKGDLVLDNCVGSGTTGVACAETKRDFIGIERDVRYYHMAQTRIARAYLDADLFT